jgi:lipopolysaccharide transport system permease protein
MITTVMMFLSPVFFPLSSLPEKYQGWMQLNPLTFIIEESRGVMIFGRMPHFAGWTIYMLVSILIAWLGFAWFQKTRKGFADVL